MNNIFIYTVIIGNYDNLPCIKAIDHSIRYICFTDNTNLKNTPSNWEIIHIENYFKDRKITNGYLKSNSHIILGNNCISVWVDANLDDLRITSNDIINSLKNNPVATSPHIIRTTITEEATTVVNCNLENPSVVAKHLKALMESGFQDDQGLSATMLVIRDHNNARVRRLNELWWSFISKGIRRDQLSFNVSVWESGLTWSRLNIDWRIPNRFYNRKPHANPHNRSFNKNNSDILLNGTDLNLPTSLSEYHPKDVGYWHEKFGNDEIEIYSELSSMLHNKPIKGDYYYYDIESFNKLTPIDPRLSWKRQYLRIAVKGLKNCLDIGFNTGSAALIMLNSEPFIKITSIINNNETPYSCHELISSNFKDRFIFHKERINTILPKLNANNFDIIHINNSIDEESIIFSIHWFCNFAKDESLLLVNDAYLPSIRLELETLIKNEDITLAFRGLPTSDENLLFKKLPKKTDKMNFYTTEIEKILNSQDISYIVQIGANDGRINDPIYDLVINHPDSTKVLLIEPQPELIPHLLKNYDSHENAFIWNGAIGNNTSLILYRIKPQYYEVFKKRYLHDSPSYRVPSGFTSSIKDHVIRHAEGNLPPEILLSEAIEEIEVPCTNLENLLNSLDFKFEKVDILQIDTEGMDDIVIYSSNIESLNPSLINFEHSNLPVIRLEALYEYLKNLNYKIYKWSTSDTVAIKL